jgi:hypothetical protein
MEGDVSFDGAGLLAPPLVQVPAMNPS